MKIRIYRGTQEIGGTCVELTADNGKILWMDLGLPLSDKNPNVDYVTNKVDALLVSHPHQDHFGLMERIETQVPIYIGQVSLDLINATKIFRGLTLSAGNFKTISSWQDFTIAETFHVTPFLVDHSSPEAFAFLIEADGKRIFYSGDFRATGRKNIVFKKLIGNPPQSIDLLLMEGTMIERVKHSFSTEHSVEEAIYAIIKKQRNVTFVISAAQNIDRLVSVFRACKRSRKYLVIDVYTAWVLEVVRKKSKGTPAIEWEEIKVFDHPRQLGKISDSFYDKFRGRIKSNKAGNAVFNSPAGYVYFVRCPNEKLVNKLRGQGTINIIYSQWEGYLREEHKNYCTDILNKLKNDKDISFQTIHTSGHARVADLIKFAKAINAKEIVPIHTNSPASFKKEFEKEGIMNVNLWEDGEEYVF